MKRQSNITKGKKLVKQLSEICRDISDEELFELFNGGSIDELLNSILNPQTVTNFKTIGDFFLANKKRAALIASLRNAIQRYYSIKSEVDGKIGYVSPSNFQWFEDGVIVLEGLQPFEGSMCLYKSDGISYAVVNRDAKKDEVLGVDDFDFIDIEKFKESFKKTKQLSKTELQRPIDELKELLTNEERNEAKYQELFIRYPWILGLQYTQLQRHTNLDDENIPDFTGIRVSDSCRDIFEMKPPTMKVFLSDGNFSAEFNNAWNQAERYLNFAREDKDYLNRKKLRFENPKCYLVCGYNLPDDLKQKIRIKEKLNPSIQLLTYNDILAFMENTISFIKLMTEQDNQNTNLQTNSAK